MYLTDSDNEDKKQEVFQELWTNVSCIAAFRYGIPFEIGSVPKSREFLCNILPNLDENRFCEIVRVKWHNFEHILNLIKDDEVFKGPNSWKQIPVDIQLIIVLYRLGCCGEGSSIGKVAKFFGVGDGGTIATITRRVFKAILRLKNKFLYWPDKKERSEIIAKTAFELPQCIGYVDGCEIKLAEKPTEDPECYFSRKQQYSIKLQAVCDFTLKIRHVVIGHPGSVHDSRIYNKCPLFTNSPEYFTGCQWLVGDSAYKLTTTVITPYRSNSTQGSLIERNTFNRRLSKYRVRIENCFGLLKERFCSLKELKIALRNRNSNRLASHWILVCCILHNIIRSNSTDNNTLDVTDLEFSDSDNDETEDEAVMGSNAEAEKKRKALLETFKYLNQI